MIYYTYAHETDYTNNPLINISLSIPHINPMPLTYPDIKLTVDASIEPPNHTANLCMWWLMTFTSIGFTVATCPNAANYGGDGGREGRREGEVSGEVNTFEGKGDIRNIPCDIGDASNTEDTGTFKAATSVSSVSSV